MATMICNCCDCRALDETDTTALIVFGAAAVFALAITFAFWYRPRQ